MTSFLLLIVVVLACTSWMAWRRWGPGRPRTVSAPAEDQSPQTLAYKAFLRGNTCLAAGHFADATTAFEQARTLDPKRPYVAERLAEVARRQHAASTWAPVATEV